MEDDLVIVESDDLDGFTFAAVFDGHAGFSSVNFLRFAILILSSNLFLSTTIILISYEYFKVIRIHCRKII